MTFTCPRCGAVSHNPNDERGRYCGRCHVFIDDSDERLDSIAKAKGLRLEAITVESNQGAPDGYGWGAWVGAYELGCKVGNGNTPDAAIEDLLDMLPDLDNGELY